MPKFKTQNPIIPLFLLFFGGSWKYIPPYSPELNPQKRRFEDIKKCLKNRIFDLLEELKNKVSEILFSYRNEQIKSLVS